MIAMKPVMKSLLVAAALSSTGWAAAQSAPSSAAKKDLIQRLLVVQQPVFDGVSQQVATRPIAELTSKIQPIFANAVPKDKQEATAKQIDANLKKFVEEAVPVMKEATTRNAPSVYGSAVEEKFTEDELRQIVTYLESPARKKWEQANQEIMQALVAKSVEDVKPKLEPKLQATAQATSKILEAVAERPNGAAAGKPAAKPASASKK